MPVTDTDREIDRFIRQQAEEELRAQADAAEPLPADRVASLWPRVAPKIREIAAAGGTIADEDLLRLGLTEADIAFSREHVRREAAAAKPQTKRIRGKRFHQRRYGRPASLPSAAKV